MDTIDDDRTRGCRLADLWRMAYTVAKPAEQSDVHRRLFSAPRVPEGPPLEKDTHPVRSVCSCDGILDGRDDLSYLVASTAHPLSDSFLAAADLSLGFHWGGYYQWFTSRPDYAHLAGILYFGTIWVLLAVVAFLALSDRRERLVELIELLASTLVVTIIVSYFAPATGAAKYYWGKYHADISSWTQFELLRSGTLRTIDVANMQGLISMPSMHTVIGALLCWSVRDTRAFAPFIVLNLMMLSATPVYGGHHAIDLVAGASMTVVAIAFRLSRDDGRRLDTCCWTTDYDRYLKQGLPATYRHAAVCPLLGAGGRSNVKTKDTVNDA